MRQDLNRTFTEPENAGLKGQLNALRNVLYCYAKRNARIGYCQGLNFIVAHLLRYMNEEEAFWTLCCLIEYILPIDYYILMIGVLIDQKVFRKLVKSKLPQLAGHLKKLGLNPSLVSLQWFICLFSNNLHFEVCEDGTVGFQ